MTDEQIEVRMCAEYWLWYAFTTILPIQSTSRWESTQRVCLALQAEKQR